MMEEQIKLAAKLYRCRDTARRFFTDEYQAKIEPYKLLIKGYAEEKNIDEMAAVMKICSDDVIKNNGWTVMLLMAAAVELIEPTK
jgi:hypothetical protein